MHAQEIAPSRGGWTIAELLVVVALIIVASGFLMWQARPSANAALDDISRLAVGAIRSARSEAMASGGEARIDIVVGGGPTGRGLLRTFVTTPGGPAVPRSEIPLVAPLRFGQGLAEVDPFGVPIYAAVPLTRITCDADGRCNLGSEDRVVFLITAAFTPERVRAVSITTDGLVTRYRYESGSGMWR